jgi:hypothetical protein
LEGAFLGSPKKATTYHPPELGYLEQQGIETQANWIEQPQLLRRYVQASARLQQHDRDYPTCISHEHCVDLEKN